MKNIKYCIILCMTAFMLISCDIVVTFSNTDSTSNDAGSVESEEKAQHDYKDYLDWDGWYEYGWMDTSLIFNLYPEVAKDGSCGKVTQNFRGNIWEAEVFYKDDVFTWTIDYAVDSHTYSLYPQNKNGEYYLDVYNEDGEHECTFMKIE